MFGIGQFAASVDPGTDYRSYAAAQLRPLNRILVLKDLGFSLAEITRIIETGGETAAPRNRELPYGRVSHLGDRAARRIVANDRDSSPTLADCTSLTTNTFGNALTTDAATPRS